MWYDMMTTVTSSSGVYDIYGSRYYDVTKFPDPITEVDPTVIEKFHRKYAFAKLQGNKAEMTNIARQLKHLGE